MFSKVTARAPGKVNLSLRVGPLADDGYHPLETVFQAVDLWEQVTVTPLPVGSGIQITAAGPGAELVPLDHTNLVHQAASLLGNRIGRAPDLAIHIEKGVPVAGGMAGGSADAAATLVACNQIWQAHLRQGELLDLAAELGSDVPFCLLGGTAVGTGRGHLLTPLPNVDAVPQYWAFAIQAEGLSTPAVFRKFDELMQNPADGAVDSATPLCAAQNDLQVAALALRPELAETIQVALEAGAARAFVSGSGPTIAALATSDKHGEKITQAWIKTKTAANIAIAKTTTSGAHLI